MVVVVIEVLLLLEVPQEESKEISVHKHQVIQMDLEELKLLEEQVLQAAHLALEAVTLQLTRGDVEAVVVASMEAVLVNNLLVVVAQAT